MQEGTHDNVTGSNARLIESPKQNTPGVEIDFANEHGEQITGVLWLTEKTMKRTVEALRFMGWRGDDLSDLSTVGLKKCQIVVEQDDYGPRLKWVNENGSTGGGGEGLRLMDDAAKRRFAALMKGQVIAASGGKPSTPPARGPGGAPQMQQSSPAGGPPAPPPGYQPQPPDFGADEDIPF